MLLFNAKALKDAIVPEDDLKTSYVIVQRYLCKEFAYVAFI